MEDKWLTIVLVVTMIAILIAMGIDNHYKVALVEAETKRIQAEEGFKLKFGVTKDKEGTR